MSNFILRFFLRSVYNATTRKKAYVANLYSSFSKVLKFHLFLFFLLCQLPDNLQDIMLQQIIPYGLILR